MTVRLAQRRCEAADYLKKREVAKAFCLSGGHIIVITSFLFILLMNY